MGACIMTIKNLHYLSCRLVTDSKALVCKKAVCIATRSYISIYATVTNNRAKFPRK